MNNYSLKAFFKDSHKKSAIYILLGLGVFFLIISNLSSSDTAKAEEKEDLDYCEKLEQRLEKILPDIVNVGEVKVMITARNFGEIVPAKNKDDEHDQIIVLNQKGGGEDIRIIEEMYPTIQGVIIVAEGGRNSKVKADLAEAVTALLGVDAHKIKVFERKIK